MINWVMFASYGISGGGAIGDMLAGWEQAGLFSYVLPFLLIFAIVFGILTHLKLFEENKTINGIIALAVGFMALQSSLVSQFFSEIFPRLGIGLAFILVLLIVIGMFADPKSNITGYVLAGFGLVIAIIIFNETAGSLGMSIPYYIKDNIMSAVGIIFLIIVFGLIINSGKDKDETEIFKGPWAWGMPGDPRRRK